MNREIDNIKRTRDFLLGLVNELSVVQLNERPDGFNNNIIWNLAHIVSAQQGVCYLRAGLPLVIEEKYYLLYKPGTKPEENVDAIEVQKIKELISVTADRLSNDHQKKIFKNYTAWTTRYGVELGSIDDAINFLLYHDGLHGGIIMSLKKLVSK